MFKIKQTPSFHWPVEVQVAGDGGKFERQSFDALFRRKTDTQDPGAAQAHRARRAD